MEIAILGSVDVRVDGVSARVRRRHQRLLIAALALDANAIVSIDRITALLWEGEPPEHGRAQIHVHVSTLRRLLAGNTNTATAIETHPEGYRLRVPPASVDLVRFEHLVAQAQTAAEAGRLAEAGRAYQDGLGLWRGPALDGLTGRFAESEAARLNERRIAVLKYRVDIDLVLGRYTDLVAELTGAVGSRPLDEDLRRQLFLPLYGSGRAADALAEYRQARQMVTDQLGIDQPGEQLRAVHDAVLRNQPIKELLAALTPSQTGKTTSDTSTRKPIPQQLPCDIDVFTGRAAEFAQVRAHLASVETATPSVCAISGAGGIGKSALAIHAAHAMRHHFPDGQLYVNLHGATIGLNPLDPSEVLGRWLRAFGVDSSDVPTDTDEAAARFRWLLAGRRVLVVCDNAADASQVRPLLTAGARCATLVTSRRTLTTLDNAAHLQLDLLGEQEAVALLARLAGTHRVSAEPEAAVEVARQCGHLPLAVRIAGAKLAAHPNRSIGALAEQLADEQSRLDELQAADLALTSSLAVSYHDLRRDPAGRAAARMFCLLSLNAGPDIETHAAAALGDTTPTRARHILDLLAEVHLIEHAKGGRYRFHDLLRIYATTRAADEPEEERALALRRMLGWYLHTADAADRTLTPDRLRAPIDPSQTVSHAPTFTTYGQALEWFDTERANLMAATRQAAEAGLDDIAWQIPAVMSVYFYMRKPWADWITSHEIGLTAAIRSREPFGEAAILTGLGAANYDLRQFQLAVDHLQRAQTLWGKLNHRWGEAITLNILGSAYRDLRRFEEAITCFHEALAIWPEIDHTWGKGVTLHNLGTTYRELGQAEDAISWLHEAIAVRRTMPDRYGEAWARHDLGTVYADLHQFDETVDCFDRALAIRREIGDRHGEAQTQHELGKTMQDAGKPEAAAEHLRQALAIFDDLHDPRARDVRTRLEIL